MSPNTAAAPRLPSSSRLALRAAAAVLLLEGLALLVVSALLLDLGATRQPENRVGLLLQALLAAVAGVLLALSSRPLLRCRAWVRSPLVVVQLLILPVGVGLVQAQVWWAAAPVLALPLAVLVLLATPPARVPFQEMGGSSAASPR